jgi:nitroreductase
METWDAIRARRDIRDFTDRPIAPNDLDRILDAGRRSPSSINWQPWDFIVVTERAQLVELAKVFPHGARHVARSAATVALVSVLPENETRHDWIQYDLGQATMSMMLAAADLGIGSGHAAITDQDLARRLLHFPPDRFLVYLLPLGYPAGRPLRPIANPRRRPFADVVHRGVW